MLDWNDLRYVLAIARAGNIAAAAPELEVHESTVLRRLNALEKQLGTRLFDRFPTGYIATPAGEEICRTAQQMEENILTSLYDEGMYPSSFRVEAAQCLLMDSKCACGFLCR